MATERLPSPLSEFRLPLTFTLRQGHTLALDRQELIVARGMAHHVNIRYNLSNGNTDTVAEANRTVNNLIDTVFPLPPPIDPVHKRLVFANKPLPLNQLGQILLATDPALCIKDILILTYPAKSQPASVNKKTAFSWISKRLESIIVQGVAPDSDIAKITVLASLYRIGTAVCESMSAKFLDNATRANTYMNEDHARAFPEKILTPSLQKLRNVQDYTGRTLTRLEETAASAHLSEEQVMLLADIALTNGPAINPRSRSEDIFNTQVIIPLIRLIAEDKWEEALAARDFLLADFPHFFPDWRVDQSYRPPHHYPTFSSLSKDLANSHAPITGDIPPVYRQFLLPKTNPGSALQESETISETTQKSVTFANIFLDNLKVLLEDQFKKSGHVNIRNYARTLPKSLHLVFLGLAGPVRLNLEGNLVIDTRYDDKPQEITRRKVKQENFSQYLFNLIARAVVPSRYSENIPLADFTDALTKAHERIKAQFPEDSSSIAEYLEAILSSYLQKTESKDADNVRQFIDSLS